MENNNWRPAAPDGGAAATTAASGGEATTDAGDWKAQLQPDSRQRIVNKIMETLKRHLPYSGQEGLQELKKIAVRFEEKIYTAATSQSDYLRKISLKMLTMESKSPNTIPNSANGNKPSDPGASHSVKPQVSNQGQSLPIPLPANKSQAHQQLLVQNMLNNMMSAGVQSSVSLQPAMTSVSGLTQTSIPNTSSQDNMQQNQLIGQQNGLGDMQQKQQLLLGQQNNLQILIQQQQQRQLQLLAQQNNLSNMYQLGSQSNVSILQQKQQMLGTQSVNPSMQTNQQFVHMMQQPKFPMQQPQPGAANLLLSQGKQSQPQQQLTAQIQSQPAQLQEQMGLQQQSNPLQKDLQQRLQASGQAPGSMRQAQNVMDQQKQLYQNQRAIQDTPSPSLDSTAQTGHANGGDWQEEAFQKLMTMKEMYFPEINEMYQKIAAKLQQHDSLPQRPKSEQLEKLKVFKSMLERIMSILQMPKNNIQPGFKDKLDFYERQIINFISTNRPRKPIPPMQQGQRSHPHLQSMQQSQSQIPQVQSHDTQMDPQVQTMNTQGYVSAMQQNNMPCLQHNFVSSVSFAPTSQQNMFHQLRSGSNTDSEQGNAVSSLQQITLPRNPATTPQQPNKNTLSSQSAVNMLLPNIPLQSNSSLLQQQHLKQLQEKLLVQNQQLEKHYQQRQIPQQLLQKMHQQPKQQLPAPLHAILVFILFILCLLFVVSVLNLWLVL